MSEAKPKDVYADSDFGASTVLRDNFEVFATNHQRHKHCHGCGGCLLDPSHYIQAFTPVYCVACVDRIKANTPKGAPLPWAVGWERKR